MKLRRFSYTWLALVLMMSLWFSSCNSGPTQPSGSLPASTPAPVTTAAPSPPAATVATTPATLQPTAAVKPYIFPVTPPPNTIPPEYADIVFINGHVITMETDGQAAEALAIKNGMITKIDKNQEILKMTGPVTKKIDLGGKTIMPGLVDAHDHLFNDAGQAGLSLEQAQQLALERGITSLADMYVPKELVPTLQNMQQQGKLRIRTSLYLIYNTNRGDVVGDWWLNYTPDRDPSHKLRIQGVKVYADGGSWGLPAYSQSWNNWSRGDTRGDLFITEHDLTAVITRAQQAGFQVAIHAIGDLGVQTALDSIGKALNQQPNVYRHRIEHNMSLRPDLLPLYTKYGIVATAFRPSSYFLYEPLWYWTEIIKQHPDCTSWFEPYRSLLAANPDLHLAWHSDWPWGDKDPMNDLWGMVTQKQLTSDGVSVYAPPPWLEEQALPVEKALRMMTIEGAYALFSENQTGSLKPGKFADLIVLSDNPLTVAPDALKDIKVLLTMVGGRIEYQSEGLNPSNTKGAISGYVYQADGTTPVAGAMVAAADNAKMSHGFWMLCGTAVTDARGFYTISGLPVGPYVISASAGDQGYAEQWYRTSDSTGQMSAVFISPPGEITGIDFKMSTGGKISGKVSGRYSPSTRGLANMIVYAVTADNWQWAGHAVTGADGNYTLGLLPGKYIIRAAPHFSALNYLAGFYNNAANFLDATPVTLSLHGDVRNINFNLQTVP